MKKILTMMVVLCCTVLGAMAQNPSSNTFAFEGKTRQYLLYVPSIYQQSNEAVPLVVVLHGLGDNMNNMSQVGFHQIADTANFIVVTPQALPDPSPLIGMLGNAWNSGAAMFGITPNATLNDSGFLIALVDSIAAHYDIDPNRIYFTGFSMGGYMSNRMACEHSDRVAAIASVAGTIGTSLTCTPERPVHTLHFHGTADGTVAYSGNQSGMDAEELVQFWRDNNHCDTAAIHTALPNTNPSDGYTIDRYEYNNGIWGAQTKFYKTTGADHTWLGPNNDVYYTAEIWKFFSTHSLLQEPLGNPSTPTLHLPIAWRVYPNPANNTLYIELPEGATGTLRLMDMQTRQHYRTDLQGSSYHSIDISQLPAGIYVVQWQHDKGISCQTISVQ
ncbi:MAG: T9SS type A sorting domain-containing protein [Chitinophagales bacterium]|nr:T9SS type A sorting domain-containing protein [Chitinophagales bacterium]